MFDAHCHLDRMGTDMRQAWARACDAGVTGALIAGVNAEGWRKQNAMAGPRLHVAWGVHPWTVAQASDEELKIEMDTLNNMLVQRPVQPVALGETGLDHGRRIPVESRAVQEIIFRRHIQLAKDHDLPLVLHIVRAHQRAISILREEGLSSAGGMVHSFSGTRADVNQYAQLGLHISFSGTVVDPQQHRVRAAVSAVPPQLLLVETDSPDQTPVSRRPASNEPAFLVDVVEAVANLRGDSFNSVSEQTQSNARTLFRVELS